MLFPIELELASYNIVSHSIKGVDFTRAMAVYSPEMAHEMVGVVPTPKYAKTEDKSNS